ncbi:cuticlin 1 [Ditylenchus destructor]|uniref:Cuticlin 1 n=1 Tax=Ditylenchus destructor TaxID=166010 RepID=A0AAD4QX46_9BILA|nr:cuticlin 1 [Ditylenchus destructor]
MQTSIVLQVAIGDPLYHKWKCSYGRSSDGDPIQSPFCIMVHNCTVSNSISDENGQNRRNSNTKRTRIDDDEQKGVRDWLRPQPILVEIIDEFGCSTWPGLMPNIHYNGDLSAGLEVNAFSLDIDKPVVFFKCNIRQLLKLNGVCRRPQCALSNREDTSDFYD